jgi:hypothetical protein
MSRTEGLCSPNFSYKSEVTAAKMDVDIALMVMDKELKTLLGKEGIQKE